MQYACCRAPTAASSLLAASLAASPPDTPNAPNSGSCVLAPCANAHADHRTTRLRPTQLRHKPLLLNRAQDKGLVRPTRHLSIRRAQMTAHTAPMVHRRSCLPASQPLCRDNTQLRTTTSHEQHNHAAPAQRNAPSLCTSGTHRRPAWTLLPVAGLDANTPDADSTPSRPRHPR